MNIKPSLALFCLTLSCTPAMAGLTPEAARVIDRAIRSAAQIKEYAAEVVHTGPPQQQMAVSSAASAAATTSTVTAAAPAGPPARGGGMKR